MRFREYGLNGGRIDFCTDISAYESAGKQCQSAADIFSFSVGNRFHGFREGECGWKWAAVLIFTQIYQRMNRQENSIGRRQVIFSFSVGNMMRKGE